MKKCKHNWLLDVGHTQWITNNELFEFKIFVCSECGYRKRKKVFYGFIEDDLMEEEKS